MIEIALFDLDGVIIAPRKQFFTDRLISDFGVSRDDSMAFVKQALVPAMTGKLDLRDVFPEYLHRWGINKSVDEMFAYWWSAENTLNQDVLETVRRMREQGTKIYLASDQEKNRGEYLLRELKLSEETDGAFLSYQLGMQKHDRAFFEEIIARLNVQEPRRIVYWDDDQKNVDVAASVGIDARLYADYESFFQELTI